MLLISPLGNLPEKNIHSDCINSGSEKLNAAQRAKIVPRGVGEVLTGSSASLDAKEVGLVHFP